MVKYKAVVRVDCDSIKLIVMQKCLINPTVTLVNIIIFSLV